MILTIDVGNSRIKAAVFENDTLTELFAFPAAELSRNVAGILKKYPNTSDAVIASVQDMAPETLSEALKPLRCRFVSAQDPMPFVNQYKTPLTLGIDRRVLAAGATLAYPGANRLVIDAGTCVTYDFIDADDNYLGGAITPGLRMRYTALHDYTAKLPLPETEMPAHWIGDSTDNAIHSGVVNGLLYEIDGFINEYKAVYPKIIIILTGGDTNFLAKRLKNTIFANSNFLLESLNLTFHYTNHK